MHKKRYLKSYKQTNITTRFRFDCNQILSFQASGAFHPALISVSASVRGAHQQGYALMTGRAQTLATIV